MTTLLYDGSFAGFLSAVFAVYDRKLDGAFICQQDKAGSNLFGETDPVVTDEAHAKRAWKGLEQRLSFKAAKLLYHAFLSEQKEIENILLRFIQYAFGSKGFIETDYTNKDVLLVKQISSKVHRERHRMEAFVRFQKMKDGLFFASVQPDFNVLPLLIKHFKDRYADQRWLIYDATRKYGIYYDLQTVEEVEFTFSEAAANGSAIEYAYDESEGLYQTLWKQYFTSVNIVARKNMKLHIRHMPKRYWKNLLEKQ